jgi:hypothetical protein
MLWNSSYQNLEEIVRSCGYEVYPLRDSSLVDDLYDLPKLTDCVIPYTTIEMMRRLESRYNAPGAFLREHNFKYHIYTSLMTPAGGGLTNRHFLNWDGILTTYQNFVSNKDFWFEHFGNNKIFIRPDSGIKIFTGYVVEECNWQYDILALDRKMAPETLMSVSSQKAFGDEVRFIICGNKVVDGSRYATDMGNTLVEDNVIPADYWELAQLVANSEWKPDNVFTVDITRINFKVPKIVEVNSFNCAGWYACNAEKIVKTVSQHMLNLWEDEYEYHH